MLLIIMAHFYGQSNFFNTKLHFFTRDFLTQGAIVAVNIFMIIAVWFMVDSDFKAGQVLKLYLQLFFYTATITMIMIFINPDISKKEIIKGFLPFTGSALWFISAYIMTYFTVPFLKGIFTWHEKSNPYL